MTPAKRMTLSPLARLNDDPGNEKSSPQFSLDLSHFLVDRGHNLTDCQLLKKSKQNLHLFSVLHQTTNPIQQQKTTTMPHEIPEDLAWQKPDWTKNTKLRSTGKSAAENLAKPITTLPHQKEDGPFEKPQWTGDVQQSSVGDNNLAKPITELAHGADASLAFQKPDWTKNPGLHGTEKGQKLKQGAEIARPIGGIKAVDVDDE
jgi:hypothetical protein